MRAVSRLKDQKEYRIWKAMKARCYSPCNKKNQNKHYQLKNITVCKRWKDDYQQFLKDMGSIPSNDHTIERINNNGDYEPSNCKWIHKSEQSKNRGAFNKKFTWNGETKNIKDWARYFGFKYTTLYLRIYKQGLSFKDAISRPLRYKHCKLTKEEV